MEAEGPTHVPQPKIGMVSPIQCQLCAKHGIPALCFCYRCEGNYQKYPSHPKKKGKPPAEKVRTKLPLPRGGQPSTSHAPEATVTTSTSEPKGEYYEEETPHEVKMSVDKLTMYAFDPEAQELTTGPHEATYHILSDNGTESQDSGLVYAEMEIKEHPVEERAAPLQEAHRKIIPRDPRHHPVALAPPQPYTGRTLHPCLTPLTLFHRPRGHTMRPTSQWKRATENRLWSLT